MLIWATLGMEDIDPIRISAKLFQHFGFQLKIKFPETAAKII